MEGTTTTLDQLLRETLIHLAAATGHLRMLAIGAPFAHDLIHLAEDELRAALDAARAAELLRGELSSKISSPLVCFEVGDR
jgi:hypothetical protein